MYCLSDQQIEYILDDIRRSGVEMEDLQSNLLDHICCILEHNLKEEDDFESVYRETVRQFYMHELREIEVETIHLLTFKNYYIMKKIMLISGALSVAAFITGSLFKIMQWQGASFFLVSAMVILSMAFLPLMAILKTKESGNVTEKLVNIAGVLTGMLYIISTLFAIQHWEGRTALWLSTVGISMFIFIPLYLYNGIQKPETRFNTIVTSILLVGFSGSLFTMIRIF